jgi:hypothetical protein
MSTKPMMKNPNITGNIFSNEVFEFICFWF